MEALSLNSLLNFLLSLSVSNQRWIADRLYEATAARRDNPNITDPQEILAIEPELGDEKAHLLSAFRQVKLLREGKLKTRPWEEVMNELRSSAD